MNNINEEKKKRYALVISLLVLMICITGSTYAYFAITASNNSITGKVGGSSLDLTVTRVLPTTIAEDDMMIPQLEGALDKAISEEYSCIDDNGHLICQVYEAKVTNLGSEAVTLNGTISFTGIEDMPNLKWKLLTDSRTIDSTKTANSASISELSFVEDLSLTTEETGKSSTYYFVFWIEETGELQTDNGEFRAVINFDSPNAESGVTSTITPDEGITYPIKATELVSTLYNDGSSINTVNIAGDTNKQQVSLNNTQKIMMVDQGSTYGVEYRYYGNEATEDTENGKYLTKNYVSFNGELWRIISSSKVYSSKEDTTGSQRLRIIRDESIGSHSWNYNRTNNWEEATLNTTLNGIYYSGTSGTCYIDIADTVGEYDMIAEQTTCDYANGTVKGLSEEARSLIDDAVWYLGGSDDESGLYASDYYTFERGTEVYDENYPTSIVAKLGIMYASDYAYATDLSACKSSGYAYYDEICYASDWLYDENFQWSLSSNNIWAGCAFFVNERIDSDGTNLEGSDNDSVDDSIEVHPVAVLKPNVMITGGTGTSGDPYQLNLGE